MSEAAAAAAAAADIGESRLAGDCVAWCDGWCDWWCAPVR